MPLDPVELDRLVAALPSADPRTIELACLLHISQAHLERLALMHDTDLTTLIDLAEATTFAYCEALDLDPMLLRHALAGLRRAQITSKYLDTLPD